MIDKKARDVVEKTACIVTTWADGGDNFTVLRDGANRITGPIDLDVLISYLRDLPQPFSASIEGRIEVVHCPLGALCISRRGGGPLFHNTEHRHFGELSLLEQRDFYPLDDLTSSG